MSNENSKDLATVETWDEQKRKAVADLVVRGGKRGDKPPSPAELEVLQEVCRVLNLDPLRGEIIFPNFGDGRVPYPTWKGRFKLASTNAPVVRQVGPLFSNDGKEWSEFWLGDEPPALAKVELYLRDNPWPIGAVAQWSTWAQYSEVDEEVEGDEMVPLLEWTDDRSVPMVPDGKGGKRYKRMKAPVLKDGKPILVKQKVKTGNKVLERRGWWNKGNGSYMLGVKAQNLASELAIRMFGDVPLPVEVIDGGTETQNRRLWGLVGEIENALSAERGEDVKLTAEQRHKISGLESWADLDVDSQAEVAHRLERFLQRLIDRALNIEEAEIVDDETDPFEGIVDEPDPKPAKPKTVKEYRQRGKAAEKLEEVRQEVEAEEVRQAGATVGPGHPDYVEAEIVADAIEPEVVEDLEADEGARAAEVEEWAAAYTEADGGGLEPVHLSAEPMVVTAETVGPPIEDSFLVEEDPAVAVDAPGELETLRPEGAICGEDDGRGNLCTLRPRHAPIRHNWPPANGTEAEPATPQELGELEDLAKRIGKSLPEGPLSRSKAANLHTLWTQQVQRQQPAPPDNGAPNQEKLI